MNHLQDQEAEGFVRVHPDVYPNCEADALAGMTPDEMLTKSFDPLNPGIFHRFNENRDFFIFGAPI